MPSVIPVYNATASFLLHKHPHRIRPILADMSFANRNPVVVLCRSYGLRSQLLQISRDVNVFGERAFRDALYEDDNLVARLLQENKENIKRTAGLQGDDMHGLLNTIEHIIDTRRLDSVSLQSMYRLLARLYKISNLVPASLLLSDVYEIESVPFASGGFGDVFRAKWKGGLVAVKRLQVKLQDHETIRRVTVQEVMKWKQLGAQHLNIVPCVGLTADSSSPDIYMVSVYIEGVPLPSYIKHDRPPNLSRLLLIDGISSGLAIMHEHDILHNDFRGANILVDRDGIPKIHDFGLSKFADATTTPSAAYVNSQWLAPELLNPSRCGRFTPKNTRASDVFAFGVVCNEVYDGLDMPVDLRHSVDRCLHDEPDNRFSLTEFRRDLEKIIAENRI